MLEIIRPFLQFARNAPRTGYKVLNSKRGNKNFYKGKRVPPVGRHTRKGGYQLIGWKLPEYVVPDLTNCELKPFMSAVRPARVETAEKKE
ncbi:hypothetical protein CYMTET_48462 [Cymbomonas tetramitiformis]|uniref:Mitochondrial ribosomal protein L41 n=1 Tax=Cymbomonas tetramitiformis TaxID=36881 RepID=A0AAE0BS82_9CHLO|nr:hypothetical protein CYMTET_48462 [Cymbomonas tetramitiformis]